MRFQNSKCTRVFPRTQYSKQVYDFVSCDYAKFDLCKELLLLPYSALPSFCRYVWPWISNCIHAKQWHVITHEPNLNAAPREDLNPNLQIHAECSTIWAFNIYIYIFNCTNCSNTVIAIKKDRRLFALNRNSKSQYNACGHIDIRQIEIDIFKAINEAYMIICVLYPDAAHCISSIDWNNVSLLTCKLHWTTWIEMQLIR